jgi:thioredoxin reductase
MTPARYDVAVIGGGPAGHAAATWAARYRRRVVLVDAGRARNRWTDATHGYLGLDGASPQELLRRARSDLERYPEVETRAATVTAARRGRWGFDVELDGSAPLQALRIILATGVRDLFPDIDRFEEFFGTSVFTCPSCDGYEAQGKAVVALGGAHAAPVAAGLLDWATSVTVLADSPTDDLTSLEQLGIVVTVAQPAELCGTGGQLEGIRTTDGRTIPCDMIFCTMDHEQHSDLPRRLGCRMTSEGSVAVDEHCATSVEHVYAAGDMTPGPHLVQVAAAKGAIAGIAAAVSLRGEPGAPTSPPPAPDPDDALGR